MLSVRFEETAKIASAERFDRMIRLGFIDRDGRIVHLAGDEVKSESDVGHIVITGMRLGV